MDTTTNPHEASARQRKVAALVSYLLDALSTVEHDPATRIAGALRWCGRADDGMWQTVADLAGCNLPSDTTRQAVRSHLEGMALAEKRKREDADPFAGLGVFPSV